MATITQELAASRDVLSMVESYKRNAGQTFAAELDILTADMRSGSYEAALTRFEARFNSPLLSDIIRGLIGALRGDNGVAYFQMLSHDMKQLELQRLKAQAMKIPPKIRVFSFLMLMCFLMTYLANPDISWSRTGRIQLNQEVTVTVTYETNIGLFSGFGSFPITLRADAAGKSEVYWK